MESLCSTRHSAEHDEKTNRVRSQNQGGEVISCTLRLFRPIDKQYRIRLDGLPVNMTVNQLLSELKNQSVSLTKFIERPEVPADATVRHFYLVRQASERLTRRRVFSWHNYLISQSYKVTCQLECDRISPNSTTDDTFNHQRLRRFFERTYAFNHLCSLLYFDYFSLIAG